jgi:hypothetical protein
MNDNIYSWMIAQVEEQFLALDTDVTAELLKKDAEYADLRKRRKEMDNSHPFLEQALQGRDGLTLTAEQHETLVEYFNLYVEIENCERLHLYYAGHRDCFAYLRKIGVI